MNMWSLQQPHQATSIPQVQETKTLLYVEAKGKLQTQNFPTNLAKKTASFAHDDIVYERASTASVSSQLCDRSGGSAYGASPAEITRMGGVHWCFPA